MKRQHFFNLLFKGLVIFGLSSGVFAFTSEEVAKLTASDGASGDGFGFSVAVDGDTAVIGAAYGDDDIGTNSGSAYVFIRSGGVWTQQAKLTASDGASGDNFGNSVALDGDTAVIGADSDDDNGTNSGSAYVFTRSGGVWTQQAKLTASDGTYNDSFADSVSVDDDTVLIGTTYDDGVAARSGSAYVFTRSGGIWMQQAKLTASDGAAYDYFGQSVAVDGDTALMGALNNDANGTDSGAAYVFTRSGGVWMQQAKLTAVYPGIRFGSSVDLDGDTALIGALYDQICGSAYVFIRNSGIWTQQARLRQGQGDCYLYDFFGASVAVDGDKALIGAFWDDDKGINSGSAYLFTRSEGVWTQQAKLTASDGASNDYFGDSVALDNDTALIGVSLDDDNGTDSGSVYVFSLGEQQPPVASNLLLTQNPVLVNTPIVVNADIDDSTAGNSDVVSAAYTIDGSSEISMSASDGNFDSPVESVTGTLPGFSSAGLYNICVSGDDAYGNASSEICGIVVVYDPDAGFVTGGGWIDSLAGAYKADQTLTGKASFGFVSTYQRGKTVPTGNTEFRFHVGGLNLYTEAYQWLVVYTGGATAQLKGTGLVNGQLDVNNKPYDFMIWANDKKSDTFRIRIWSEIEGVETVVYDNGFNQAISGGSITIHSGSKKN